MYVFLARRRAAFGKKMVASSMARAGRHFRRPLFVAGKPTPLKVVKLKDAVSVDRLLRPLKTLDEGECFLVEHVRAFGTGGFKSLADIVLCDAYWQAQKIYVRVFPETVLPPLAGVYNVWVMPPGAIAFLDIKKGTIVATGDRSLKNV